MRVVRIASLEWLLNYYLFTIPIWCSFTLCQEWHIGVDSFELFFVLDTYAHIDIEYYLTASIYISCHLLSHYIDLFSTVSLTLGLAELLLYMSLYLFIYCYYVFVSMLFFEFEFYVYVYCQINLANAVFVISRFPSLSLSLLHSVS